MIGDPYEDRPASHAVHHATGEGRSCECGGGDPPGWHVTGGDLLLVAATILTVVILAVLA